MNYRPGETLNNGKYIIEKQLGIGAFGITYKAVQNTVIKLPVVIKTPNQMHQYDKAYPRYVAKFIQEAELLGTLCQEPHPNIVKLIDYFEEGNDKAPCLVMEFIPGQNLFDLIEPKEKPPQPLPELEAVNYIRQIGDALIFMHQNSIVHSDIHPGNIMLSRRRHPVLIDFGLAGDITPSTSSFGSKFGHENFIPYERRTGIRNEQVDIYGLAAILYYIVTGKLPTSCWDRRYEKVDLIAPQQHEPSICNQINQAILAGMALEAQDRPQSMQEWLNLLQITPPPAPPRKRRRRSEQAEGGDITLSSDVGVDYSKLRDYLQAEKWREADEETLAVMLKVAGREEEGWLDVDSINNFPCTDLRTIDQLWVKYSNGRFGFSVQKRIWESVGGKPDADYETWCKFGDRVGWRVNKWLDEYKNLTFNIKAQEGHLPFCARRALYFGWLRSGSGWVSSLASRLVNCNL